MKWPIKFFASFILIVVEVSSTSNDVVGNLEKLMDAINKKTTKMTILMSRTINDVNSVTTNLEPHVQWIKERKFEPVYYEDLAKKIRDVNLKRANRYRLKVPALVSKLGKILNQMADDMSDIPNHGLRPGIETDSMVKKILKIGFSKWHRLYIELTNNLYKKFQEAELVGARLVKQLQSAYKTIKDGNKKMKLESLQEELNKNIEMLRERGNSLLTAIIAENNDDYEMGVTIPALQAFLLQFIDEHLLYVLYSYGLKVDGLLGQQPDNEFLEDLFRIIFW